METNRRRAGGVRCKGVTTRGRDDLDLDLDLDLFWSGLGWGWGWETDEGSECTLCLSAGIPRIGGVGSKKRRSSRSRDRGSSGVGEKGRRDIRSTS